MLRKISLFILILLVFVVGYLCLAPVVIEPQIWQAPAAPGYVGAHAVNQKLAGLKMLDLHGETGPEHVAFGADGALYIAADDGKILRMQPDGKDFSVWAKTGGRVLGLAFDASGRMIAADSMRGLLAISSTGKGDAKVEVLLDHLPNDSAPLRFVNSVVVAKNGKIYFTDSSTRFGAKEWGGTFMASVLDILEHSATGRVIEYEPTSGKTRIVLQDLCFANGVALSQDEQSLFVAETGAYRVWKLNLAATSTDVFSAKLAATSPNPDVQILLNNLPGYPDNLMRGVDGKVWLGFAKPRGAAIDNMAAKPFLRKVTLRLPQALWPVPPAYGHVIAFDEQGKIVADLQDPSGSYPETTGVVETADKLFIQSLHAKGLGWKVKSELK